jgi:Sensors of blue-light using FAD
MGEVMQRLLYVSESNIEALSADRTVSEIIERAQVKNAQIHVTGALIFTGQHFAQVLEGSPESISMLMAYIYNDPRHTNIVVFDKSPITQRQFPDWTMAYHGPAPFVSRHIAKLREATSKPEQRRAADWLTDLAREFSSTRQ